MLAASSYEKKTAFNDVAVVCTEKLAEPSVVTSKSRVTQKHVIIAVTCTVVVGLLVIGVIVGIKLVTDSAKEIEMYKVQFEYNGKTATQDVVTNADSNVVQYHMVEDGVETWNLEDFNREIRVIKMTFDGVLGCYVTPLNYAVPPDAIVKPDSETFVVDNSTAVITLNFLPSTQKIVDTSILGIKGQALCDGLPSFWMVPHCSEVVQDGDQRARRQIKVQCSVGVGLKGIVGCQCKVTCYCFPIPFTCTCSPGCGCGFGW